MKKLLITSMAAVAVSICAKATETYTYNTAESFESYNEGPLFGTQEGNTEAYGVTPGWVTDATPEDGIFTVTNIANYVGSGSYGAVSRPTTGIEDSEDPKALAIDTSNPLMRTVHTNKASTNYLEQAVFFDSVVQFTATDSKPTPGNDDKLMVWLYASDDVGNDNPGVFGETTPTTNLIITAGYNEIIGDTTELVVTNYLTGVGIEPDSWHRLTIKAFKDNLENVFFNVWVDGTKVVVDGVTDFSSLLGAESTLNLTGVAFDGKGAVDDLVFTTTAPEFAKEDEPDAPKVFALNLSLSAEEVAGAGVLAVYADGEEVFPEEEDGSFKLNVGTENALAWVACNEGYKVINEGATYYEEDGYWIVPINVAGATENGTVNVTITVEEAGGGSGEDPEDPEVPAKPTIGGTAVETAEAFIAAANSGVAIKVPTGWTLDGNTLKDADGNVYATFADYYTVELATDGTVTLQLNDSAKPTIDETAADKGDAIVVTDAAVALGVTNAKVGLWYGVQAYSDAACTKKIGDEPTGWEKATGETVTVTATKPEGDKAFFKVVVDDQDHSSEEQN